MTSVPPKPGRPPDEDGYELWLRYVRVNDPVRLAEYQQLASAIHFPATREMSRVARAELTRGLRGLLGREPTFVSDRLAASLHVAVPGGSARTASGPALPTRSTLAQDGFRIVRRSSGLSLEAATDHGLLYGVFHLLRQLQLGRPAVDLPCEEQPQLGLRMLDHWDNPYGTVERGYAGFSLWKWHLLPGYVDPRYEDYARALASVGLNATSPINVNSDARILTPAFLDKVAALATVFRRYGIRLFLTARFSAPVELGATDTADPIDHRVQAFWSDKAREIYQRIPDFGGFLVKANSEGQPGPQDYGRSHARGANLLARALAPFGGLVIWRAFVYDDAVPIDRAKQAYDEFVPLDGQFDDNVLLQIKNGPIDFQPREPFHPLFGALRHTPAVMELQLTQEYLGHGSHLVYQAPMWREVLDADTFATGPGATVQRCVDGTLYGMERSGLVAVANTGTDRNWCGHPFAQANWYAFGRLAWDVTFGADAIAEEWLRLTFGREPALLDTAKSMMLASHPIAVDSMTPLGLHHLMAKSHHYGPGPWVNEGRADWTSVYYHRADAVGLGFDRTASGSNAVGQYFPPVAATLGDAETCPEALLLWFHRVPWDRRLGSGRSLWDELCWRYQRGVEGAERLLRDWESVERWVDERRFEHVRALLGIQLREAKWWRDACLAYFHTFAQRPFPAGVPAPEHELGHYQRITSFPVPGAPWLT